MNYAEAIELVLDLAYDKMEEYRNFNDIADDEQYELYNEAILILEDMRKKEKNNA